MQTSSLYDVFTPTKPATITFVEREIINDKLVRAMRTPGKQIVVFGHSGSGKSTLIKNKLHQLYESQIITRCLSTTTFEQLILNAFDQLNPYYEEQKIHKTKTSLTKDIGIKYFEIKTTLKQLSSTQNENKSVRMLPPQLTPQRLAEFIGISKCCWVIEDFHKVSAPCKDQLAGTMKIFADMSSDYESLKIIALGAVETGREIVEYDSNMKDRVTEVHVPLMTESELKKILYLGGKALNIEFTPFIQDEICKFSNGLATVCHQLALNICDARDIYTTQTRLVKKFSSADFNKAVSNYIDDNADTFSRIFEKALTQKRKRKYNNCHLILNALARNQKENGLLKSEILSDIRRTHPEYPPGNLSQYLEQLRSDARAEIIRYTAHSEKYDFINPFFKAYARMTLDKPHKTITKELIGDILNMLKIIDPTSR